MTNHKPLAAILTLSIAYLAQAQLPAYKTYTNARFAYSISYPSTLTPQGEAENGDGQKFLSSDGRTELIVYGSNNALEQTLRDKYNETRAGKKVTYAVLKSGWFVVSGVTEGKVFYQKTSDKKTWDPITVKIAVSFKGQ